MKRTTLVVFFIIVASTMWAQSAHSLIAEYNRYFAMEEDYRWKNGGTIGYAFDKAVGENVRLGTGILFLYTQEEIHYTPPKGNYQIEENSIFVERSQDILYNGSLLGMKLPVRFGYELFSSRLLLRTGVSLDLRNLLRFTDSPDLNPESARHFALGLTGGFKINITESIGICSAIELTMGKIQKTPYISFGLEYTFRK